MEIFSITELRCRIPNMNILLFLISFLSSINSYATTQAIQYFSHTPVTVCQPSDSNSNCGGGGSGNVGIGTENWVPFYPSNGSNLNANSSIQIFGQGGNVGIGTNADDTAGTLEVYANANNANSAIEAINPPGGAGITVIEGISENSSGTGIAGSQFNTGGIGVEGTCANSDNACHSIAAANTSDDGSYGIYQSGTGQHPNFFQGNVGINSQFPGQQVDIQGTVRTTGFTLTGNNATAGYILQSNGSTGVGTWVPSPSGSPGGSNPQIQYNNNGVFSGIANSGADSNGNLGIGTFAPMDSLHIQTSTGGEIINYNAISNGIDSNTVLMLHMDGANGGTTFTDSENTPKSFTVTGTAQTSSNKLKFGSSSGSFGSASGYIYTGASSDFTFSGDFTFDFWIYFNSHLSASTFFSQWDGNTNNTAYLFEYSTVIGGIRLFTTAGPIDWQFPWSPSDNTWYHVALVRSGSSVKCYINGSQIGTTVTDSSTIGNSANLNIIAREASRNNNSQLDGYIDEFRVSKVARWTSNFVPPTDAYAGVTFFPSIVFQGSGSQVAKIWVDGSISGNPINIDDSGRTRITLINGNLGIGSSSPTQALDVNGTVKSTSFLQSGSLANNFTGNVGVGSSNPGQALDVSGTVRQTGFILTGNGAASGFILQSNGLTGVGTWVPEPTGNPAGSSGQVQYNNSGVFGGTSNLFISGSNVGVGSTNPGQVLDVNGAARLNNTSGTSFNVNNSGTSEFSVTSSGVVTANAQLVSGGTNTQSTIGDGLVVNSSTVSTANGGDFIVKTNVGIGTLYVNATLGSVGIGTASPTGFEIENGTVGIGTVSLTSTNAVGIGTENSSIGEVACIGTGHCLGWCSGTITDVGGACSACSCLRHR